MKKRIISLAALVLVLGAAIFIYVTIDRGIIPPDLDIKELKANLDQDVAAGIITAEDARAEIKTAIDDYLMKLSIAVLKNKMTDEDMYFKKETVVQTYYDLLKEDAGTGVISETEFDDIFNDIDGGSGVIMLVNESHFELKRATVTNSFGSFQLHFIGNKKFELIVDGAPVNAEYIDHNKLIYCAHDCTVVIPDRLVDDAPEDLGLYGLANPRATVFIELFSNAEYYINIGDDTPTGDGYYFTITTNPGTVYMMRTIVMNYFIMPYTTFYKESVLLPPMGSDELRQLTEVKLFGKNREPLRIIAYPEDTDFGDSIAFTHYIDYPVRHNASVSSMQRVFEALSGLTPNNVLLDKVNDENLIKYGFDDPSYILEFTFKGETVTLIFGNENQKGYYYLITDIDYVNIWYINVAARMPFLNMTFEDFAERMLYSRHIDTIKSITVESDATQEKWAFDLVGIGDDLSVYYNKQTIAAGNFRNLYREFLSLQIEGMWPDYANLDINSLKRELAVTIEPQKGEPEIIAFYRLEDRKILYTINGSGVFYIISNQMDKFIDNTRRVANKEAVIPTW